jgi:Ankyrin repeats (3 copies)
MSIWKKLFGSSSQPKPPQNPSPSQPQTPPTAPAVTQCDVCTKEMERADGYILTTNEVTTKGNYWEHVFSGEQRMFLRGDPMTELRLLGLVIRQKAGSPTGWVVCETCSSMFEFDKAVAKECAVNGMQPPNCGPADETAVMTTALAVKKLMERDSPEMASILDACRKNDVNRLIQSCKNNNLIAYADSSGNSLLHIAAESGAGKVIDWLLRNNVPVNGRNAQEDTPLHRAAEKGFSEAVSFLLINGALPRLQNMWEENCEHVALVNERFDCAEILCEFMKSHPQLSPEELKDLTKFRRMALAKNVRKKLSPRAEAFLIKLYPEAHQEYLQAHKKIVSNGSNPTPSLSQPKPSAACALKEEDLTFGAIVEELVSLHQAGFDWGLQNRFPVPESYPQYPRVKRLGELIYAKAGYQGMQDACQIIKQRVVTRDGGGQDFLAKNGWVGIGGWRP